MRRNLTIFVSTLCLIALALFARGRTQAQLNRVPARIIAPIDESKLAVLRGNTHPLTRAAFDRGPAADSLQMDQMLLVLQRSASQQAALDRLLAAQQDKSSPSYRQWLSPDEFGQQFGVSDADVQKVEAWLASQGFALDGVSRGRDVITFSGNAAQVHRAFHTTIHNYVLNDQDHLANATDPAIPAALAPVVAGVRSLNNFFPKPKYRAIAAHGMKASIKPHLTLTDSNGNTLFGVGPADFATIYGITPLWNAATPIDGTGVTIAIVSGSDINTTDVNQFRTIFGLPAIKFTQIIPKGSSDPGIVPDGANAGLSGDESETEAIFDVEWSGAVAKGANIDLVASKDSATSAGIDLSAQYIVDQDLAPILSESYGNCELSLGSAGNAFYNNLWSQAAAEGITVSISTGDNGSDACDFPPTSSTATGPFAGVYGLGVNGIASTPYDIAVGGTDFNDHVTPNAFWTSSNAPSTLASAQSYVPETTWNDTCTNSLVYTTFGQPSAAAACNTGSVQNDGNSAGFYFVAPVGGSGGMSNCTAANTNTTSNCSGGYAKPSWQSGPGVPADGKRDIPDVSFFAEGANDSYGLEQAVNANVPGSFYFACEEDAQGKSKSTACSTSGAFLLAGGTSVSAQVFAGIVALVDQQTGSAQGNLNPSFYALAAGQSGLNCDGSNTTVSPNAACIFHDVTSGTIAMPCQAPTSHDGTSDCDTSGGGPIGILTGYNAGTGYDLATGLGSLNVANFVGTMPYLSVAASPSTVTVPAPGQSGSTTLTFTANNGFTATIGNLACSNLPAGASCSFAQGGSAVSSLSFNNTTTTANVTLTVNTSAGSAVPPVSWNRPVNWTPGAFVALAGVVVCGIWLFVSRGSLRPLAPVLAVFGLVLLLGMAGCGGVLNSGGNGSGNGSGTPSGSTTAAVTVTNTVTNAVMSFNFTLAINQ
ncbi:MAG TPA: S53 family peptidase [Candidatus Acidoferrales bacterium]